MVSDSSQWDWCEGHRGPQHKIPPQRGVMCNFKVSTCQTMVCDHGIFKQSYLIQIQPNLIESSRALSVACMCIHVQYAACQQQDALAIHNRPRNVFSLQPAFRWKFRLTTHSVPWCSVFFEGCSTLVQMQTNRNMSKRESRVQWAKS